MTDTWRGVSLISRGSQTNLHLCSVLAELLSLFWYSAHPNKEGILLLADRDKKEREKEKTPPSKKKLNFNHVLQ